MVSSEITSVDNIPDGSMKHFDVGDLEITIARVGEAFYAFDDRCPHMNSPLHQGKIEGLEVVCPLHKARFNIVTGKKIAEPRVPIPKALKIGALMSGIRSHDLKIYPVTIENDKIYLEH